VPSGPVYPITPDGRYFVVRGRLWLMAARRAVGAARRAGDKGAEDEAHAAVDQAKHALGERGPVWWTDGAPDLNRHLARTGPYAEWFAAITRR
jgi:hypothetical protein